MESFAIEEVFLNNEATTKQQIASTFRPVFFYFLGTFNSIFLQSKIFIISLCRAKVDWDQQLDEGFLKSWIFFCGTFEEVSSKRFPGRTFNSNSPIKLYVFIDASKEAYGCVFYVKQDAEALFFKS